MGGVIQRRARPRPKACTLPAAASESSARCTVRWLRRARARAQSSTTTHRRREKPAPPRAPLQPAAPARRLSRTARHQREAASRRAHVGQRAQLARKRPISTRSRARCDSSACLAPNARATSASRATSPGHASPSARASSEQHRTRRQRDYRAAAAHDVTARVHDERVRREQRFDVFEQEQALARRPRSAVPPACRERARAFDLRRQSRNSARGGRLRALLQRRARRFRASAAASRCQQPSARARSAALAGKGAGSRSASTRSASSSRPISSRRRTSRYRACAALTRSPCALERRPRRVERLPRPAQFARDQRDLRLGDDASRAGDGLCRTERPRRASQQRLRSREIAELRHRDAAQRKRRRIVAQRDPLECAERIAGGERARRGRDQRVHRNPATLVTPTVRCPPPDYLKTMISRPPRTRVARERTCRRSRHANEHRTSIGTRERMAGSSDSICSKPRRS